MAGKVWETGDIHVQNSWESTRWFIKQTLNMAVGQGRGGAKGKAGDGTGETDLGRTSIQRRLSEG
jgi:hypothetical protein